MPGAPFVVGISWRTAPVAVREKFAVRDDELAGALRSLAGDPAIAEAMLISTCNRVEVYGIAASDAPHDAANAAKRFLLRDRSEASAFYVHGAEHAVRHVFRVAAALDSLVLGEAQILGQLKAAYNVAGQVGTTGPVLTRFVERAFGVAKRTRNETTIARGAANVSSVAVELAARVFGDLTGKHVLVVGAGKMSTLAARHLRDAGAGQIVVTNRSPERATQLAATIGGIAKPWAELNALLERADVVISSTGAREPIFTRDQMRRVSKARRHRPLVLIDIAVPRDADPAIAKIDGMYLFDIDDLERVVAANLAERGRAAESASALVDDEVREFTKWMQSQGVVPTIRALRDRFTSVADAEVQKTIDLLARRDATMTTAEREQAIRRMAQSLVNKLLHQPQTILKESPTELVASRVDAVVALFDLDLAAKPTVPAESPPIEPVLLMPAKGTA